MIANANFQFSQHTVDKMLIAYILNLLRDLSGESGTQTRGKKLYLMLQEKEKI